MVGGVPVEGGGGVGRGRTDENLLMGVLVSFFGGFVLATGVVSVDDRRAHICLPRERESAGRATGLVCRRGGERRVVQEATLNARCISVDDQIAVFGGG